MHTKKDVLGWRQTCRLRHIQAIEEYQRLRVDSNFFSDMCIFNFWKQDVLCKLPWKQILRKFQKMYLCRMICESSSLPNLNLTQLYKAYEKCKKGKL